MTTEDYISTIEDRKKNKQSFSNVDWSQMPEGVDKARVADALGSGLDPEYASEIKRRFSTNQPIKNLDYSKVKFAESSPQPIHSSDVVTGAIRAALLAPQELTDSAMSGAKAITPSVEASGEAVAQRPELQPFQVPSQIPQGGSADPAQVAKDAARAAGQTLAFPIRVGATLQAPQQIAQSMTTDALLKKGVNPYVAYATGMLTGIAMDPMTIMSAGEIASAYGAERAVAIKGRMSLKTDMAQMDVKVATDLAKYADEAGVSQAQDLAAKEAKVREFMGQLPTAPADGSAGSGPMKTLAIPQGEPKDVLLRQQTGPTVPQYIPGMSQVKTPQIEPGVDPGGTGLRYYQKLLMEKEVQPVAGKVTFEHAKVMPEEARLSVPEKYDPTRPETREIPKAGGTPPEIIKPGGVHGEKISVADEDPLQTNLNNGSNVYQQLADAHSKETEDRPPTESSSYSPPNPPHKLDDWIGRSTKELGDLRFAQEVAAPTENRVKDLFSTIRRYAGHQELARSDAEHMMYEMADYVPENNRRVLISMYADLGRAPTLEDLNVLRQATKDAKVPDVKRLNKSLETLMGQNLNLSDQEGAALNSYVGYFKDMGEQAQKFHMVGEDEGKSLVPRLREKYGGPHIYVAKEEAEKGLFKRIITGKTRFAKPREFDNMVDAAKNGFVPKTMDAAELLGIYHNGINKAASQKYLMNALEKQGLINWGGEGARIKGFEPTARMLEKNFEGESKPTLFTKSASSPFPEVQKAMKSIAADQWELYDNSWFPAMERINRGIKTFNLYLQVFHPKALAAEAISKGYSPGKFMDGLKMIDKNPDYVRSLIRNGLIVNDAKDIGREAMRETALNYKGPNPLKLVQKAGDMYTDWVFRKYMTGLKVYNSSVMIRRLTEMGIPQTRAVELAVDDSNRIFGGLNLTGMARSENMQRIFRLVAFAPDWTESKLRQMGSIAGAGMGPDLSAAEKSIMAAQSRKYWVNMTALATATHFADQINPFNRVLSVDLSQETGFKDVKKLAMLAELNPIYFTSKMSPLFRDLTILSDPHMRYDERIKKILDTSLPIAGQSSGALRKALLGTGDNQ